MKERAHSILVEKKGDMDCYGDLKVISDENIFAACDKAEMRKVKILLIAISDYINTFINPSSF